MKAVYLIQATYGFIGKHNGAEHRILMSGLNLWTLIYDGTPEGLQQGFLEAQKQSDFVARFEADAINKGIPFGLGSWLLFSVIEKF